VPRGGRYTKTVSSRLEDHKLVVTVVADISWRGTNMQAIVIKIYNNVPDVRWVITFRYVGTPYCYPLVLSPHRIILNYRPGYCFGLKKILIRFIESVFITAFTFDHPPQSSAEVKERVELYLCSTSRPSWPVIG
jgi:hypothetical protein